MSWENVPEPLRLAGRWSTWRYVDRDGRRNKVPSSRVNDARTWVTFEEAVARASVPSIRGNGGIGFLLGNGWCGVDLDHVDAYEGSILELLREIGGYQEVSPSGAGIKCIGRGDRVGLELNFRPKDVTAEIPAVTLWTGPRFFTITGDVLSSSGNPLDDLNLSRWPGKHDSPRPSFERPAWIPPGDLRGHEGLPKTKGGADFNDEDLLAIAKRHPKFLRLWHGETGEYGGDSSRADAALCAMLAFYTGKDEERIDKLFRKSKLMRDKWETNSYRKSTIRKAVLLADHVWEIAV